MNNSFTQFGNNNDIINNIAMEGNEVKINVTILTQNGVVSKKIDLRFQYQHLLLAKTN
jgi:hypothetical protein